MENNDSRQQDGGNLEEIREDIFADPFDGGAASGERSQAIRHYEELVELLDEE